ANADSAPLKIRFAPLPPTVTLAAPEPVYEGEHSGDLIVHGTAQVPVGLAGFKYETTVLVNDEVAKDATATVNEKEQAVIVKVPGKPGATHRVELRLSNKWGESTRSNAVLARYWSPPTNIEFARVSETIKKPLIELHATVTSRSPLTATDARVES